MANILSGKEVAAALNEQMIADATGGADCFANANTPTELKELEHRAVANM